MGTTDGSGNYSIALSTSLIEGVHQITITQTDPAGNVSPSSAALDVTIDITPPDLNAVEYYNHSGDHSHIDLGFTELIDLNNDQDIPGFTDTTPDLVLDPLGNPYSDNVIRNDRTSYKTSYTSVLGARSNIMHLTTLDDKYWTSNTLIDYTGATPAIYDIAGNAWPNQVAINSIDNSIPIIWSGMAFSPDGGLANREQIIFSTNEELDFVEGGTVTGFSTNQGGVVSGIYTSKGINNYITLTSSVDGSWNQNILVSYTPGDVLDLGGNALPTFSNEPILLKNVIIRSNNAAPNTWAKSGDKLILDFTTTSTLAVAPIVTIAGSSAVPSAGSLAPNYIYEITTNGTTPQGIVGFSIVTDEVDDGDSTNVTITTPGSQIIFDREGPTITPITIASDYLAHPY